MKTTGAESPWSNGVCERYNGVIEKCVIKTLEDTKCSFDIAVAWGVSAKNTLNTMHGFSPNQLVFGKNPSLPSVALNKPPALEGVTACDVVAENLNAMHAARKAYIASESSEILRRALRHQVRPSISARYNNGDLVYFKRNDFDRWLGPGTVIGTEHKQVLVKHGGSYVRVHPCRLIPYSKTIPRTNPQAFNVETSDNGQKNMSNVDQIPSIDLRGHFDDSELPNEDVTVDSEALSQPESNGNEQSRVESAEEPSRVVAPIDSVDLPKPAMKISHLPKIGQILDYRLADNSQLNKVEILSRAGKATGANKFFMNMSQMLCA